MCSSKDSFLSKNATAEKNKLMDYFKDKEIDFILTSDSIRAVQTAEAISSIRKTQLILTSNLNERKVSDFYSNTSIEELIAKRKLMGHFFSDPTQDWNNVVDVESDYDVYLRFSSELNKYINKYKSIVCVTHAGVIKSFIHNVFHIDIRRSNICKIKNGCVLAFQNEHDFNDIQLLSMM